MELQAAKDLIDVSNFTKDQINAYTNLIDFINSPYNPNDYKRALVGSAGTGKTYLIRALIKNCNLSHSLIGLAATTHKAARIMEESINIKCLKANTLQSDLGLKPNFDSQHFDIQNPPFDPKGRIKIGDYRVYIVDESSMITRSMHDLLEKVCKTKECKIIYIGDERQLPPIGEKYCSAFRGVKLLQLNQIVRQNDDNPIRHLLSLLRYDIENKTFRFLEYITKGPKMKYDLDNVKGYCICNKEEFLDSIYNNFNDDKLTKNVDFVKIVCYTNLTVSAYNKFVRENIIADSKKSILTSNDLIISHITIVDQFNKTIIRNSEEYIVRDIVNYTHPKYNLKGFMVRFQAIYGGQISSPLFVLDHTDKFSILKYVQISNELINKAKTCNNNVRGQHWRDYYTFKESCLLMTHIKDKNDKILFKANIDYGFALVVHKAQGSTFDTVFVDVKDIVYDKNGKIYPDKDEINKRLYVACSRCKTKLYLKL